VKITCTRIAGLLLLTRDIHRDSRGSFSRLYCEASYASEGLPSAHAQINVSSSRKKGTLRGLHFQYPPSAEVKIVTCLRGAIFDVAVDLRPQSATFLAHQAFFLSEDDARSLVVPRGCAHGFLSLEPNSSVVYLVSERYNPGAEDGVRYDDRLVDIAWPGPVRHVSDKDRSWPPLVDRLGRVQARMLAK